MHWLLKRWKNKCTCFCLALAIISLGFWIWWWFSQEVNAHQIEILERSAKRSSWIILDTKHQSISWLEKIPCWFSHLYLLLHSHSSFISLISLSHICVRIAGASEPPPLEQSPQASGQCNRSSLVPILRLRSSACGHIRKAYKNMSSFKMPNEVFKAVVDKTRWEIRCAKGHKTPSHRFLFKR